MRLVGVSSQPERSSQPLRNRLRALREAAGKGLRQVAREVEIDPTHLRLVELGQSGMSDVYKARMAAYYGVRVEYLFDFDREVASERQGLGVSA